jgi:hypothetical protein
MTDRFELIFETAVDLLKISGVEEKKIRLLGISMSNFGLAGNADGVSAPSSSDVTGSQLELF